MLAKKNLSLSLPLVPILKQALLFYVVPTWLGVGGHAEHMWRSEDGFGVASLLLGIARFLQAPLPTEPSHAPPPMFF